MGAFFPFLRCREGSWPGSVWGTGLCVHVNIQGAPSDRALKGAECEGRCEGSCGWGIATGCLWDGPAAQRLLWPRRPLRRPQAEGGPHMCVTVLRGWETSEGEHRVTRDH